jgi:O-antigen/teichoic acid export membrane protein
MPGQHPGETDEERWDRNFGDLLQELRVAQTGVQILFAFLLTLAFTQRFTEDDDFERTVYLIALLSAACATALIIAPVAYHRMLFRQGKKEKIVRSAQKMATGGLAFVVVAMVCAVLLVTDVVLNRAAAVVISGLTLLLFLLLWFILPARHRVDETSPTQE